MGAAGLCQGEGQRSSLSRLLVYLLSIAGALGAMLNAGSEMDMCVSTNKQTTSLDDCRLLDLD